MSDIQFKDLWRKADPVAERDALAFWEAHRLMPKTADPAKRLSELCCAAYAGGQMIAISTAKLTEVGFLRSRIAMWRCAITPAHRGQHLSTEMGRFARGVMEDWARAHQDERVMGIGTTIQTTNLDEKKKRPIWHASGMVFVGYSAQDEQIRVAWFDHAEID